MLETSRGRVVAAVGAVLIAGGLGYVAAAAIDGARSPQPVPSQSPSTTETVPPVPSVTPSPSPSSNPSSSPAPTFDLTAYSTDAPDSLWVVTNKIRPVNPIDYAASDLAAMPSIGGTSGQKLRAGAAAALETMQTAADVVGAGFKISTANRTYAHQKGIYDAAVAERGVEATDRSIARPGYSEHQTGWSVDVFDTEDCRLKQCFGDRPAGVWLAEHAWEYGFIIRYPEGKEGVTGYIWEPWHLRYVGVELATEMRDTGVTTLEEVFGLPAAPAYL